MKISDRLRLLRDHLGLTQPAIAMKFHIPLPSWKSYEKGPSEPGAGALRDMALAGVNVHWVLTGEGEMLRQSTSDDNESGITAEVTRTYSSGGSPAKEASISAEVTKSTKKKPATTADLPMNPDVLYEVIVAVETNLMERDLELAPKKKALLIQLLYEHNLDAHLNKDDTTKRFFDLIGK